jgi:hypothetical protein
MWSARAAAALVKQKQQQSFVLLPARIGNVTRQHTE